MFTRRFDLFSILGFRIRIDLSWFIIAILITWSLATGVFPRLAEDLRASAYWVMGLFGALGLFASVVLHELSHALMARRYGLAIRGITLFIFGGVAELDSEPPSARAEFMVAIAGPVASVLIGVACLGVGRAIPEGLPSASAAVLAYLGGINIILAVFNMIPAFPLDGGRVLRSLLWHWKSDLRWATRITSFIGSGFGMMLIALGAFEILFSNDLIGGMWMILIGMFVRNAARMSYQQLLMRRALEGEPVSRFMQSRPVTVPRSISVADLVDHYIYRYHFKFFPVVDEERLVGCVTTRDVRQLPRVEWERQSVGAIATPCSPENTVAPGADAMAALGRMSQSGLSRLMVVEGGRLVGILALKDLLKFLALKVELEPEPEEVPPNS